MARPLPPVYFLLALITMALAHFYYPIAVWLQPPWTYLGIGVLLLALGWILWAAYLFKHAGTTIKPYEESSALVLEGPYRFSRNPIYLGLVTILFGVALLFGSLSPLLVIPTFAFLIQEKFIKMEEGMLKDKFGEEYHRFCERVRRWI
ncbi:MAG: isoprenylcysteine carboxylmethyltransferase family protein [Candidatus Omnitrophica bacterium]|nr:isoprenylcysteine carboxylmethyltransferase family protein [Candidatus Omnitrophota bacterium]